MSTFYEKVSQRAYQNYLNRVKTHLPEDSLDDWVSAEKDQIIEERVKEEAFINYLKHGDNSELNWNIAEKDINDRIRFLAFYLHESNINKTPLDNWKEAEKIYIENF